jgi:hypothetical protein
VERVDKIRAQTKQRIKVNVNVFFASDENTTPPASISDGIVI